MTRLTDDEENPLLSSAYLNKMLDVYETTGALKVYRSEGVPFIKELLSARAEIRNLERADLIQTNREDGCMSASQEAAHYNWLDDQNEELKTKIAEANEIIKTLAKHEGHGPSIEYLSKYSEKL